MAFVATAQAQQFDAALGFGTVKAPAASNNGTNSFPSLSGGLYTTFSGDILFWHHLGFGGEVSPRWSQSTYGGVVNNFGIVQKYRPIFYDFNAVYGRNFQKKFGADVMAGIGGEDLRFYQPVYTCNLTCTNYVSSNHFAGHIGADLRFYFWGHAFIRPEAHYYIVHNNQEFNNVSPSRFTISIGYSFMPGF
jgi:outer membrane protein with beta-barrel domain